MTQNYRKLVAAVCAACCCHSTCLDQNHNLFRKTWSAAIMIVKQLNHFTELSHKSDSKGVTVVTVLYNFTMDSITFTQTCLNFSSSWHFLTKYFSEKIFYFCLKNSLPHVCPNIPEDYYKNIESTQRDIHLSFWISWCCHLVFKSIISNGWYNMVKWSFSNLLSWNITIVQPWTHGI